jgi:imidazolonepropionase-like amidohydrolase
MDLTGQYVMPGLVDSPVHLPSDRQELERQLEFLFDGGVTAVRDLGGDAALYAQLAPRSRRASSLLPRLYYSAYWAGPSFWAVDQRWGGATQDKEPGEVPWALAVTDSTDLVAAVSDARSIGASAIKIYSDLSPQLIRSIAAEAHRQGLKVWSRPAVFPVRPAAVVPSGVDVISHSALFVWEGVDTLPSRFHTKPWTAFGPMGPYASVSPESPAIVRLFELMQRRGVMLDATVSTIETSISQAAAEWSFGVTALAKQMGVSIAAGTDRDDSSRVTGTRLSSRSVCRSIERERTTAARRVRDT